MPRSKPGAVSTCDVHFRRVVLTGSAAAFGLPELRKLHRTEASKSLLLAGAYFIQDFMRLSVRAAVESLVKKCACEGGPILTCKSLLLPAGKTSSPSARQPSHSHHQTAV